MTDTNETQVEVMLKSCPLCAKEAFLVKHSTAYDDHYSVICSEGCCETANHEYIAEAITAWNTRIQAEKRTAPRQVDALFDEILALRDALQEHDCDLEAGAEYQITDAARKLVSAYNNLAALEGDE